MSVSVMQNCRSEPKEILGLNRITKKRLLELCKKDKLYQTPSLNDVLYLHYQGFQCIECLEDYTELKCLWLECNALSEIQGLENQSKLKCLFLQSNLIKKIENLEYCRDLDTINLSQNQIRKIENINSDILPVLNTLNISSNYIKDCDGLKELENCKTLSVVDLSNNRIDDILVVKIFAKMPELKVLVLQGNPVVSKIPQYRKTLILECKNLTYLDSRPVFPKDRACAEAWKRGGYQEERKENERWNRKERKKIRDSVNATIRMRNKNRKPEDHLTLLVSSDTEDETAATKRRRQQQKVDAAVNMELDIWDEVAGGDGDGNQSETVSSSEMNNSSSTSVQSSTDSQSNSSHVEGIEEGKESLTNSTKEEKKLNVENGRENNENMVENMSMEQILKLVDGAGVNIEEPLQSSPGTELNNLKREDQNRKEEREKDLQEAEMNNIADGIPTRKTEDLEMEEDTKDNATSTAVLNPSEEMSVDTNKEENRNEESLEGLSEKSDASDDAKDSYAPTIEAIHRLTSNNLSDPPEFPKYSERRVHLQVETNDDNYEPLDEMEAAMSTMVTKEDSEIDQIRERNAQLVGNNLIIMESQKHLMHDQEINRGVTKDFEEMSSNMSIAMAQFERDQEERQEIIEALFSEKAAEKDSSSGDSGSEMKEVDEEELRIKRIVDIWDQQTQLKSGKGKEESENYFEESEEKLEDNDYTKHIQDNLLERGNVTEKLNVKELATTEFASKKDKEKTLEEAAHYNENNRTVENLDHKSSEGTIKIPVLADISKETSIVVENLVSDENLREQNHGPSEDSEVDKPRNTHDKDFYLPLDITSLTRVSNAALDSFEREARELKNLLQKLEDDNEQILRKDENENAEDSPEREDVLHCGNLAEKEHDGTGMKEEIKDNDTTRRLNSQQEKYDTLIKTQERPVENSEHHKREGYSLGFSENSNETSIQAFCEQTVTELIQSLDLSAYKPESFELELELDIQEEVAEPQNEKLPLSRTIRGVINSFNDIFKTSISENPKRYSEVACGNEDEKSCVLKELVNSGNLKRFNADTHASLDAQLAEYQEDKSRTVRGIVNRVYEQKDRYDDTIELIDGKLMVVHRDTGELTELPPSRWNAFGEDSDTDYDTAESGEEMEGACCSKPRTRKDNKQTNLQDCNDVLVETDEEKDGACCSKPRTRVNVCPRNWGPYTMADYKPCEILMHRALGEGNSLKISNTRKPMASSESDEDEEADNFYSLDPYKSGHLYDNIASDKFDSMTFDHLHINEEDERHIVQCVRSYEELKPLLTTHKEGRHLSPEEEDLLEKMVEIKAETENDKEMSCEDDVLRKLMQRTREVKAKDMEQPTSSLAKENNLYKSAAEHIPILSYNPGTYDRKTLDDGLLADMDVVVERNLAHGGYSMAFNTNCLDSLCHEELEKQIEVRDDFVVAKDIKETLNRQEQECDNKVAKVKDLATISDIVRCSENEENEIENNMDMEVIMEQNLRAKDKSMLNEEMLDNKDYSELCCGKSHTVSSSKTVEMKQHLASEEALVEHFEKVSLTASSNTGPCTQDKKEKFWKNAKEVSLMDLSNHKVTTVDIENNSADTSDKVTEILNYATFTKNEPLLDTGSSIISPSNAEDHKLCGLAEFPSRNVDARNDVLVFPLNNSEELPYIVTNVKIGAEISENLPQCADNARDDSENPHHSNSEYLPGHDENAQLPQPTISKELPPCQCKTSGTLDKTTEMPDSGIITTNVASFVTEMPEYQNKSNSKNFHEEPLHNTNFKDFHEEAHEENQIESVSNDGEIGEKDFTGDIEGHRSSITISSVLSSEHARKHFNAEDEDQKDGYEKSSQKEFKAGNDVEVAELLKSEELTYCGSALPYLTACDGNDNLQCVSKISNTEIVLPTKTCDLLELPHNDEIVKREKGNRSSISTSTVLSSDHARKSFDAEDHQKDGYEKSSQSNSNAGNDVEVAELLRSKLLTFSGSALPYLVACDGNDNSQCVSKISNTEIVLPVKPCDLLELPHNYTAAATLMASQPEAEPLENENKVHDEYLHVDVLECNLEILGCNDDVVDSICVNAEIRYEN